METFMTDPLCTDIRDSALDLVDLQRYPIATLDQGAGAAFLQQCRDHMRDHGWCNFDNFLRPDALDALASEAKDLLPKAEILTIKRNIYQGEVDPSVPADDPRRREYTHHALQLADDQIPGGSLIQRLYKSELLTDFIRRVQDKASLYRYADEFQALNIVALQPGSWHGWHYDVNECTVTLLLQAAEKGGEFTFIPDSRKHSGEDTAKVDRFLAGDMNEAQTFGRGAGTLTLFRGGYSLHGVSKVEGTRPRVTAILTYEDKPGCVAGDEINIRIYGPRVERILAARQA